MYPNSWSIYSLCQPGSEYFIDCFQRLWKMIIPIRCFSCGKVIGNKWEAYLGLLQASNYRQCMNNRTCRGSTVMFSAESFHSITKVVGTGRVSRRWRTGRTAAETLLLQTHASWARGTVTKIFIIKRKPGHTISLSFSGPDWKAPELRPTGKVDWMLHPSIFFFAQDEVFMLHQCLTEESSSSLREWSFASWPGTLGLWWCCLRGGTCLSRNSNPGSAKSKGQGLTLSSMLHFYQHFFSRTYSFQSIKPSSATMSKMTQDAKKDEFRKYLEKAGVLELLTKSLVSVRLIVGLEYEYWNSDAYW